ncbi:hypothetical protein BUALT_Bualt14G0076100 [Buddleja alternifolia]|uniref:Glycosyltransferase n=1 Tax=Buddleja alternifolia TaxID=168488 RepID=A0AAV6WIM1_9LAMI|nr:hypothetical protein BUALT_Bualt14G0076100 [Buddleja alternifolia]
MPSLPELPPQLHTTKNLPPNLLPTLIKTFQLSSTSFSEIVKTLKPDLLIYDFFQPWAPKIAFSQNIPSVYFAVSGATLYSFHHHLYTQGTSSNFPYQAIYLLDHEKSTNVCDRLQPIIKDADNDFAFGNFTLSSDIILMKSSRGVEGKYIDYLSVLCNKPVVPTGPLVVHGKNDDEDDDDEEDSEILKWLSEKNHSSTIFISFGSEYILSENQIEEIAKGLELCDANFIWVVRFPIGEVKISIEDKLPLGFLDMVKERGMVVSGWAPQTRILGHSSIGGFVSHCGWSSVMESMYFGVPIIGMPIKADQPINARMVVEAGVGVEVGRGKNGNYAGEEIAKAINKVIVEKTFYEGLRNRAKKLSEKIKEKEEEEVNEAAEQLLRLCMKNKQ